MEVEETGSDETRPHTDYKEHSLDGVCNLTLEYRNALHQTFILTNWFDSGWKLKIRGKLSASSRSRQFNRLNIVSFQFYLNHFDIFLFRRAVEVWKDLNRHMRMLAYSDFITGINHRFLS